MKKQKKVLLMAIIFVLFCAGISFLIFNNKKEEKITEQEENVIEKLNFNDVTCKKEVGKLNKIDEKDSNIYLKVDYPVVGQDFVDKTIKDYIDQEINNIKEKYLTNTTDLAYYFFVDYETYVGPNDLINVILKEQLENINLKIDYQNTKTFIFDIDNDKVLSKDDVFKDGYEEILNKYNDKLKIDFSNEFNFVIKNDYVGLYNENGSADIKIDEIKDYLNITLDKKNDYSNDVKESNLTIINKEMAVSSDTYIYKDVSKKESLGSIVKDTKVKVYANSDTWYSLVFFNEQVGYIDKSILKEIEKVIEVKDTKEQNLYITMDANVREGPGINYKKLGVLKSGEKVIKTGVSGSWIRIKYNDKKAYISSSVTSTVEIKKHTVKLNVPPQGDIDTSKPMVALTFDDGPNNTSTVKILDTLEKYNAKATFFDLGKLMLKYPSVSKREASLGEVGTHTYSHKNLNALSTEELEEELKKSKNAYKQVLGEEPILLRAPYGNANANVKAMADMPIIYWTVDTLDWKSRNKDNILNQIDKAGNLDGKIILMHSIYNSTAEAVEILVPELIDKGYQLVTVSQLASYRGYQLQTGTVYYSFK